MSTYRATDPCTDILLDDLISPHESRGNYNAVIGAIAASDDLGAKSLDQIYGLMVNLVNDGRPSSAVGRYQIIEPTLRELQAEKHLAGSLSFTPHLQDSLAVALLVRRGYQKWWRGTLSDEDFLHRLSCEWASLPDPGRDGKSHYDGDGVNSAGMTLAHAYAVMKRARAAQPSA